MKDIIRNPSYRWTLRLINFSLICLILALLFSIRPILIYIVSIVSTFAIPVAVALIFALATQPLIFFLRKNCNWPNKFAKLISILIVLSTLILFFAILIPLMVTLTQTSLPKLQHLYDNFVVPFFSKYSLHVDDFLKYINVSSVVGSITNLGSNFLWVVIIYLFIVIDIEKIRLFIKGIVYSTKREGIIKFVTIFDTNFNNYIKALVSYSGIAVIYYGSIMVLLSLPWTFHNLMSFPWYMLGPLFGILVVIPYFGPIIGVIMASLTMLNFGTTPAIVMAVGLTIANQIDANLISIKVIGSKLELNAIIIILTILLTSSLLGFTGILVTPLMLVVMKTLIDIYWKNVLKFIENRDVKKIKDKDQEF